MTRALSWLMPLTLLLVEEQSLTVRGRWILAGKGRPYENSCDTRRFGLQSSGLVWDGELLWLVSDQSSSCPGCLFAIRPSRGDANRDALRLEGDGLPLLHQGKALAVDGEGIALLKTHDGELVFAVVLEEGFERYVGLALDDRSPGAAFVVRVSRESDVATVSEIWRFELPGESRVRPYQGDGNRQFEGIAIDRDSGRGYLAYEQDQDGLPRLFAFEIPKSTASSSTEPISVVLQPVDLDLDFAPEGKSGEALNFNDLAFYRPPDGLPRLYVLGRNRELLLILDLPDPTTARLHSQATLHLLSPRGQPIVWASPEGITLDEEANKIYIVSDPDPECGGNWKASDQSGLDPSQRRAEADLFAQFVPLLFELKMAAMSGAPREAPGRPPIGFRSAATN